MAQAIIKAFHVLGLLALVLLVQKGNAFEFKVGGTNGWAVPSDPNSNSHNQWAEKNRFQIGDNLLFVYSGDKDSVLSVTKEDYANCNTDKPLKKFTDGKTVFKFEQSGPHYFISGVKDNCLKNEKLIVVVLADRSKAAPPPSNETAAAPPPSNSTATSPPPPSNSTATSPPSPSAETPPSPAPTSGESPSAPPSSEETNPTPAPSQESSPPHKNGASSILTSFISSSAAFVAGSSLLLLL